MFKFQFLLYYRKLKFKQTDWSYNSFIIIMEKEIKKLSYSIKEYYMDSFKYQLSENKYNEFQKIFIKLSNLSYGVYPNDDGSDFEIMSVALKLKNDYSIHFSCHKINEMSLYIQHDKKISYLIQNRKTFNGTYKMKQTTKQRHKRRHETLSSSLGRLGEQ